MPAIFYYKQLATVYGPGSFCEYRYLTLADIDNPTVAVAFAGYGCRITRYIRTAPHSPTVTAR